MKLYFTFEERTMGLLRASTVLSMFFTVLALAGLLVGSFQYGPGIFFAVFLIWIYAIVIALIACQVFGHPIWFFGNLFGLNGPITSTVLGLLTGIVMLSVFAPLLGLDPLASIGILMTFTVFGTICGIVAYREASKMRQKRLAT